jgi:class 3 adenylate cyclase/tetratricopeptide (TPR) repeat protein
MVLCPSCGQENPEQYRLCGYCGTPLHTTRPQAEERKIVTVLFCDLVGFTAASDHSDPEDVRARIRPYHARLRTEIERFGGTVEKFIGDAVMAVYGAPVAHEDDAERAVRSGLRIIDAIGELNEESPQLDLQVRVGIETGQAVVTLGAHPEQGESIVTGDVVNTASRLQGVAPVGGIVVGEQTFQATQHAFDYGAPHPAQVKGKAEPLVVYRVLAAKSRAEVEIARPASPFIGREDDLLLLKTAYRKALRGSSVQLVTVTGEPGVGKSRLVSEFYRFVDDEPDLVAWRQGRCLPYGEGITFWALGEIVKAHAGILESDPIAEARGKLRGAVQSLIEDDSERDWIFDRVSALVSANGSVGTSERLESFTAWRRFLESIAATAPLVIVVEDLHWADEPMVEFLEHLVDYASEVPILIVCTARPELFERRPTWGGGKRNATTIGLSPLSDEETSRLVDALLSQAVLPAQTHAGLLDRAGGNPLYAEEFVRIARRPRGVGPGGASATSGDGRGSPPPDDHPRTHRGPTRHARRRPEAPPAGCGRDRQGVLVGCCRIHGRPRRGHSSGTVPRAGPLGAHPRPPNLRRRARRRVSRAVKSLEPAGDRARYLDAAQAEAHYLHALELSSVDAPERAELQLKCATVQRLLGKPASAELLLRASVEAFGQANRSLRQGEALVVLFDVIRDAGRTTEARQILENAIELLAPLGETPELARALVASARDLAMGGSASEALEVAKQAFAISERLGMQSEAARALQWVGIMRTELGDLRGVDDVREALVRALDRDVDSFVTSTAYNNLAEMLSRSAGPRESFEVRLAGVEFAELRGLSDMAHSLRTASMLDLDELGRWDDALGTADIVLGSEPTAFVAASTLAGKAHVLALRGQVGEARELIRPSLHLARGIGDPQTLGWVLAVAALTGHITRNVEGAIKQAREYADVTRAEPSTRFVLQSFTEMIRVLVASGQVKEAEALVEESSSRAIGLRQENSVLTGQALLDETRGDSAGAATRYGELAERWRGFGNVLEHGHALLGAGRCLVRLGEASKALERLRVTHRVFLDLGARPLVAKRMTGWRTPGDDRVKRGERARADCEAAGASCSGKGKQGFSVPLVPRRPIEEQIREVLAAKRDRR